MSGGSHNYLYNRVEEEYCGAMHDIELDDLMTDIVKLLHDLEWYDSGDYGENTYRELVNKFKKKWFGTSREDRLKEYVDKSVESVRNELYSLIRSNESQDSKDQESDDSELDFGPWIFCTEKLPDKSGFYNVLVIDENGKQSICSGIFEVIEDDPKNDIYTDERRSVCNGKRWRPVCNGTVVSWRDYPAPKV